jgi:hypothetical protein
MTRDLNLLIEMFLDKFTGILLSSIFFCYLLFFDDTLRIFGSQLELGLGLKVVYLEYPAPELIS